MKPDLPAPPRRVPGRRGWSRTCENGEATFVVIEKWESMKALHAHGSSTLKDMPSGQDHDGESRDHVLASRLCGRASPEEATSDTGGEIPEREASFGLYRRNVPVCVVCATLPSPRPSGESLHDVQVRSIA